MNGRSIDVEQISLISDPVVLKEQEAVYNQNQSQQSAPTQTSTRAPEIRTHVSSQESPISTVSPNASQTEIEKKETVSVIKKQGEVDTSTQQTSQKKVVVEQKTSDWKFPGKNKSNSYE